MSDAGGQTLQELKNQVRYLSFLLDNMNELLYIFDTEGRVTFLNKKAIRSLGYESSEEILGRLVFDFIDQEMVGLTREQMYGMINDWLEGSHVLPIVDKNGSTIIIKLKSAKVIENDQVVGSIVVAEDITESRKAKAALRQSEERYRDLFENATDMIFITDLNGRILSINNACEHILGFKPYEMKNKSLFNYLIPEHVDLAKTILSEISRSGMPNTGELSAYDKNHNQVDLEVNSRLMYQDGKPYAIQGIVRNITERKQTEEKLKYLGLYDSLTGLHNRAYFTEEMRRVENGRIDRAGIIVCDLDGLKLVNDNLGHNVGDSLLVAAAIIMRVCFRKSDVVARIGGDEFAVLLPNSTEKSVEDAAARIRRAITSYNASDPPVALSMSVGCATRHTSSTTINELFKVADNRMYQEKIRNRENLRRLVYKDLWEKSSTSTPPPESEEADPK